MGKGQIKDVVAFVFKFKVKQYFLSPVQSSVKMVHQFIKIALHLMYLINYWLSCRARSYLTCPISHGVKSWLSCVLKLVMATNITNSATGGKRSFGLELSQGGDYNSCPFRCLFLFTYLFLLCLSFFFSFRPHPLFYLHFIKNVLIHDCTK